MKPLPLTLALAAVLALSPLAPAQAHAGHTADKAPAATTINAKQAATRAALRDLWVEHVFWVRNYVVAGAAKDRAAQKVATDQVVANATALSGAIASFYGKPAGDQMLSLLAGHWTAVKDHADATFAGNAKAQQAASTALVSNAKQIAAFLAKANPHLPEPALVGLLSAHGAHHLAQNAQLAKGDYAAEARTWSAMRTHMLTIADAMADALAKQFPDKF